MDPSKILIVGDSRVKSLEPLWRPLRFMKVDFKSQPGAKIESICTMIEEATKEVKYNFIVIVGIICDIIKKTKSEAGIHDAGLHSLTGGTYPSVKGVEKMIRDVNLRCEIASPDVTVLWVFPYPSDMKRFICSKNNIEQKKLPLSYARHLDQVTLDAMKHAEKLEVACRDVLKPDEAISWFPLWKSGDITGSFNGLKRSVRDHKPADPLAPRMTTDGIHPTGALGAPLLRWIGEVVGKCNASRRSAPTAVIEAAPTAVIEAAPTAVIEAAPTAVIAAAPTAVIEDAAPTGVIDTVPQPDKETAPQTADESEPLSSRGAKAIDVNNNMPQPSIVPKIKQVLNLTSSEGSLRRPIQLLEASNNVEFLDRRVKRHSRSESEIRQMIPVPLNYPLRGPLMFRSGPTRLDHQLANKRN